jgi:glycerol-3-phosphate O-acyltransferase
VVHRGRPLALGKLLPPRFGLLAYVVDAYRRGKSEDVHLVPVAIAYDQIQDVGDYTPSNAGAAKQRENFGWFLKVVRNLRRRYGAIHLRFGEPVSLSQVMGPSNPDAEPNADEQNLALQKLAFEVSARINRVTPVTPTSLVTLALLGRGDRAQSVDEVVVALKNLLYYVRGRDLPTTGDFDLDDRDRRPPHARSARRERRRHLLRRRLRARLRDRREPAPDGGVLPEHHRPLLREQRDRRARAAARRRGRRPRLPKRVLGRGTPPARPPQVRVLLRRARAVPPQLTDELQFHAPGWEETIERGPAAIQSVLRRIRPFTAQRVLLPFFEAYRVVADGLARETVAAIDEKAFLTRSCRSAEQYRLQRRIRSGESVSGVLFEAALRLAKNRGLLTDSPDLAARRTAFAAEIRAVLRRIEAIDALAASRRAG